MHVEIKMKDTYIWHLTWQLIFLLLSRCVPNNKRAFASGVWYVTFKTFGLLPSPVIFGHIMDESCRLWQNICGKPGRCFDYDVTLLSRNIAYFGFIASGEHKTSSK